MYPHATTQNKKVPARMMFEWIIPPRWIIRIIIHIIIIPVGSKNGTQKKKDTVNTNDHLNSVFWHEIFQNLLQKIKMQQLSILVSAVVICAVQ